MVAIRTLTAILTYVIGLCGTIPLFPWLTGFPRAMLVLGLISGLWQDRRGSWQLKPWIQNVAIVPVFLYYAVQFSRFNPVQPVISVLAIMLAVRLSGEKTVRHSLQIFALSMFCLASSSLFDLSPLFLIYLGILLFIVAIALVLLTFQNQDYNMTVTISELKRILYFALLMPVIAVPLLLFFFPIMPRTRLPLWNFLNQPEIRTSGYSDTVDPGSQASIAASRTLVLRAEMDRMPLSELYWRGTVFNRTDGNKWTRSGQIPSEQAVFVGQTAKQIIYPEPSATRNLIALDRPATLSLQRVTRSPDGVIELSRYGGGRLNYSAESQPTGMIAQQNSINRSFYLQLPETLPARINALAARIVRSGKTDQARVESLENYFRTGGYRYTTVDLATGSNALEQFLFDKKQGHCEFFASSFAILLRAAGVPSRLVGGYLGGEYNDLGGYYLVTDDRAHVWVEAYIGGRGWLRIDPSGFATNAGEVWAPPGSRTFKLALSLMIDSFNYQWNRSVITYDFEQQVNAARHVGLSLQGLSPAAMLRRSLPFLVASLLIAVLLAAVKRTSIFSSREQRILQRFLGIGIIKPYVSGGDAGVGLFEMSASINNCDVSEFVEIYAGAIYHDRKLTDDEYLRLKQILGLLGYSGESDQRPG